MDFRAFVTYLDELLGWYKTLPTVVQEEKKADALWVVELIERDRQDIKEKMMSGNIHGLAGTLQGMRGILTRPGKGSILNLNKFPELNEHAGVLYDRCEEFWRNMKDFNGGHQQGLSPEELQTVSVAAVTL